MLLGYISSRAKHKPFLADQVEGDVADPGARALETLKESVRCLRIVKLESQIGKALIKKISAIEGPNFAMVAHVRLLVQAHPPCCLVVCGGHAKICAPPWRIDFVSGDGGKREHAIK